MSSNYDRWKTAYPPEWDEEEDDLTADEIASLVGDARCDEARDDR